MKRGIIFYVTEGREHVDDGLETSRERERLGADAVSVATSEFEISYAWWHMLTRGIQQISCMTARVDEAGRSVQGLGRSLRIYG